ncbi:MAG TPA: fibronectin type III domain-containing protein [Thermoanaerobaculia bacterium]|nr:fibronectin type III domain-containing protein [Thermoanaerobaculia bacterium]
MTAPQDKRQSGFTLTEVLIASAIFTIIFVAALMIYDRSNKIFKNSVESADLQQSSRVAFDKLVADVRMLGFDYDRDGIPSKPGSFQQPDEQIEYAGTSAIVFRANLDYNTDVAHDNGRENVAGRNYEPAGGQFPVVTTANDEIAIYALKSDKDPTKNTSSFDFYADTFKPRKGYPGGSAENKVTVSGIDLTNTNPPYTLYRFTLDDRGAVTAGVPIASNIRSLNFDYNTDAAGKVLLTTAAAGAIAQGAIGGLGQYDPNNIGATANFADRDQRAKIQSVRIQLTGMTENPDITYTNPLETSTVGTLQEVKKFRTYTLESLIVPRNIGLAGLEENASGKPGPPKVTSVCIGHCAMTVVSWDPPTVNGSVDKYEVHWSTSATGPFNNSFVNAFLNTSFPVDKLTNGTQYYFQVWAWNDSGPTPSSNVIAATPINKTQPDAPMNLAATQTQPSQITLTWDPVTTNKSPLDMLSCAPIGGSPVVAIPSQERIYYRIWRSMSANTAGVLVLDDTNTSQPALVGPSMTWVDNQANAKSGSGGVANCVTYYYRIQTFDKCSLVAAKNFPAFTSTGESAVTPAVGNAGISGLAGYTPGPPPAPQNPTAAPAINTAVSSCNVVANTCSVTMTWPAVTTDVTPSALTVDSYDILVEQSIVSPVSFSILRTDNIIGQSLTGGLITYTDTAAQDHDPFPPGKNYIYRYSYRAHNCSTTSNYSPTSTFPSTCGSASIVELGAANPAADGLSPSTAWVLNTGDTVTAKPPVAAIWTITRTVFAFSLYPAGTPSATTTVNSAPFTYGYTDQADGNIYRLDITVTHSDGCVEQDTRYIQDAPGAPCNISAADPDFPLTVDPNSFSCPGSSTSTSDIIYKVVNGGPDVITLKQITITFRNDTIHPDEKITRIFYNGTGGTSQGSLSISPPTAGPLTIPGGAATIPIANSATPYQIVVRFTFLSCDGGLSVNPISSVCLSYTIPSETATKFCNIAGQGGSSLNPNACD